MKIRKTLAVAAAVAAAGFAAPALSAEEAYGPYISAFAGIGFTGDARFSGIVNPPGGQQTVDTSFDNGFNFGGAIGYGFDAGLGAASPRFELELSHLSADADQIDFTGNGAGFENNVDGDISRTLLVGNLLLDIHTNGPVTPYVGVGAGLAFTNADVVYGGAPGGPAPISFDDSGVEFAGQLIAGASYRLSDNISLFADGRYTRVFGFNGDRFGPGGLTGNVSDDVDNFSVNVGVRYRF